MVIVFPRKSFQLCNLADFNRAIYCNLEVSISSLSYSLQSKTNRNSFFLICGAREIPLTSVLKLDVLLAWLVKFAHNVLKCALISGDKTNLFSWNISHATLVSTQNRKLSANSKMFLKQIKQNSASVKHFRYSVPTSQDYGVIVSVVCTQSFKRSICLTLS